MARFAATRVDQGSAETASKRPREDAGPPSVERILQAATESFADRGFHATTTRDISKRANLSPAAIYMHYKSKAELLYRIMKRSHEELLEALQGADLPAAAPAERLRALMTALVLHHAENRLANRVSEHELPALAARQRKAIVALRDRTQKLFTDVIRAGTKEGEFHDVADPKLATYAILTMGVAVANWYRPGGRLSPDAIAERYAEMAIRMVQASSEPRSAGRVAAKRDAARASGTKR